MDKVRVGKIVNTFGLRGELKVKSFTDFPEDRFRSNSIVYLEKDGELIEKIIAGFREHKGLFLLRFKGEDSINDVEKYKNSDLFVLRSELHELEPGEYYFFELKDFDVVTEENEVVGKVKQVEEGTVSNYLRIEKENHETILVPFIDAFVKKVDKEKKVIIIQPIEGLI